MPEEWSFSFNLPSLPKGKRVSVEEAEGLLLDKLREREIALENAIWELAKFYGATGRQMVAFAYVERLITSTNDPEKKATYYLSMGQLMEQIQDYETAISFYTQALSLEPISGRTWYFINNNLGYCLNHFGKYKEAEPYCRAAIKTDPGRCNAHKNLGISLEGQGQFVGAAKCFILAVRANASDPRALIHLGDLLAKHREISLEIPDIFDELQKCREAVRIATGVLKGVMKELNGGEGSVS